MHLEKLHHPNLLDVPSLVGALALLLHLHLHHLLMLLLKKLKSFLNYLPPELLWNCCSTCTTYCNWITLN
jgi:hypothetical protein